ncbi:LOW QUALITY PROTEIN: hypothetical protein V1478_017416 [Vespula squamosa]|uniref:Maturase K n=1 Tax=Vespula squamosa TaxID=30214 RepID=A0ABD1ZZ55_VESSQ
MECQEKCCLTLTAHNSVRSRFIKTLNLINRKIMVYRLSLCDDIVSCRARGRLDTIVGRQLIRRMALLKLFTIRELKFPSPFGKPLDGKSFKKISISPLAISLIQDFLLFGGSEKSDDLKSASSEIRNEKRCKSASLRLFYFVVRARYYWIGLQWNSIYQNPIRILEFFVGSKI